MPGIISSHMQPHARPVEEKRLIVIPHRCGIDSFTFSILREKQRTRRRRRRSCVGWPVRSWVLVVRVMSAFVEPLGAEAESKP